MEAERPIHAALDLCMLIIVAGLELAMCSHKLQWNRCLKPHGEVATDFERAKAADEVPSRRGKLDICDQNVMRNWCVG